MNAEPFSRPHGGGFVGAPRRLLAALALLGLGWGATPAAQATSVSWQVTDVQGRTVKINDASRIVSVGASATEIIYALGEQGRLVGVDSTSKYPPAAQKLPQVGYLRGLASEGLLSLNPSLILAVEGAGPPNVIKTLQNAAVPFVLLPSKFETYSAPGKIRLVAAAIGVPGKGERLAAALEDDIRTVEAQIGRIAESDRLRVMFMWNLQRGTPISSGLNTAADAMIKMAGGRNAFSGFEGYKPIATESLVEVQPQVILAMQIGRYTTRAESIWGLPHMKATPAGRDKRLIMMDPGYVLGFGPRTAHAMLDLARALYPDRSFSDLPDRPWTRLAEEKGS